MQIRNFALISGIVLLLFGVLGFIPGLVTPVLFLHPNIILSGAYGLLFGLFPINWLDNVLHIALGIWGVATYRDFIGARTFSRTIGVIGAIAAVFGFIPGLNTLFGIVPLFGHDIWFHAVMAALGCYFGWIHEGRVGRTPSSPIVTGV